MKRDSSREKWRSILDEDNSKIFEIEMTQTLSDVNCFITKIEIESSILSDTSRVKNEETKKFKQYLAIGRELLMKLKILATLEKASAMDTYEQSYVRKLSYAATEDTTSGVDTESLMESYGVFNKEESFDRRDSRTITLVHKYAASFTKHYQIFDKLNHDVEEIIERFNNVLDFIHQQLQLQTGGYTKVNEYIQEDKFDSYRVSLRSEEENKESVVERSEIKSSATTVDILMQQLQNSSLVPTYKHVNASGAGHLIEHTYSCSVVGLYSEGRSRKKSKAKEEAATQMIKEIIKRQMCNNLPIQIIPFSELQIQELSSALTEREDVIDKLEEKCLHSHEPPPLYTVLSETGKSNEPYFTIKCEAMGYTAVGYGSVKIQAKKNSAKSILNLVGVNKKSKISF